MRVWKRTDRSRPRRERPRARRLWAPVGRGGGPVPLRTPGPGLAALAGPAALEEASPDPPAPEAPAEARWIAALVRFSGPAAVWLSRRLPLDLVWAVVVFVPADRASIFSALLREGQLAEPAGIEPLLEALGKKRFLFGGVEGDTAGLFAANSGRLLRALSAPGRARVREALRLPADADVCKCLSCSRGPLERPFECTCGSEVVLCIQCAGSWRQGCGHFHCGPDTCPGCEARIWCCDPACRWTQRCSGCGVVVSCGVTECRRAQRLRHLCDRCGQAACGDDEHICPMDWGIPGDFASGGPADDFVAGLVSD